MRLLARSDGYELDRVTIGPAPANSLSSVSGPPSVDYRERRTDTVAKYAGSDPDPGDTVTLSLGGVDAGDFSIDSKGNLTFNATPDYENPQDTGRNNVYNVTVRSSDGKDPQGNPNTAIDDSISVTVNVTDVDEPPGKPRAPTVSSDGQTSLNVSWSAPSNDGPPITDYDVQYREGSSGGFTDAGHSDSATMTTVSGLDPATCYQVQVLAKNAEGTGDWSDSGSGCTTSLTAPGPVQDLSVTPGNGSLRISWEEPSSNGGSPITMYRLQYRSDSDSWPVIGSSLGATIRGYLLTGLTNGTEYHVRVRACNRDSNGNNRCGDWSEGSAPPAATAPGAVQDLSVTPGDGSLSVSWAAPSSNGGSPITGYKLQHKLASSSWPGTERSLGASISSYPLSGLTNGTPYDVRVRACNGNNRCGDWSEGSAEPAGRPGTVQGLSVTAGNGSLTVSWSVPSSNGGSSITEYRLQYRSDSDSWPSGDGEVVTSPKTIDNLTNGTEYHVRVKACNNAGCGNWEEDSATPTDPHGSVRANKTSIRVADPVNVTAYDVWPHSMLVRLVLTNNYLVGQHGNVDGLCDTLTARSHTSAAVAPFTRTFVGCFVGTETVKLVEHSTGNTLDTVDIEVTGDPATPLTVTFGKASYEVKEGSSQDISLWLNRVADKKFTIEISVSNGTAEDSDYSVSATSFDFVVGDSSKTFRINTIVDSDADDETVNLRIDTPLPEGVNMGPRSETTLTIKDNRPPTIECSPGTVSYQENRKDTASQCSASDPDQDNVTLTVSSKADGGKFSISPGGALSFVSSPNHESPTDSGGNNVYNVTVVATDDGSPPLSSEEEITVTVTDVNEPPEKATEIDDQTLTLGGAAVVIDLSDKFTDPEGDTLTYGTSLSATGVVTVSVSGSYLTVTPTGAGTATVTVTAYDRPANDGARLSASQDFTVVVGTDLTVSFESSEYGVTEGGEARRITVNLSAAAPSGGLDIPIAMSPGPAPAPMGDYRVSGLTSGNLNIPAGQTSNSFTIKAENDTVPEGDEEISLSFNDSPADGLVAGMHSSATVTIPYNDLTVSFGSSNYTVVEGDSVEIEVTLNAAPGSDLEIPIQVTRVSAEATDYTVGASVTFAGTSDSATLTVGATDEPAVEGDETIRLGFGDMPSGGVTAGTPNTTTVTIKDKLPQLAKPTGPGLNDGIDVVPLPERKIKLVWNYVPHATLYYIDYRPLQGTGLVPYPVYAPSTSHEFDLDDIFDHKYFSPYPYRALEFRVRALDTKGPIRYRDSEHSDSFVVIDTPIFEADGDGVSSSGNPRLEWRGIPSVAVLGIRDYLKLQDFRGGSYSLRYRKFRGDHSAPGWLPEKAGFETDDTTVATSDSWYEFKDNESLDVEEIYAIQLRYETASQRVYAARDVYVWPSSTPAYGERVGSFPLKYVKNGNSFTYHICNEIGLSGSPLSAGWKSLIRSALGQWETSTNRLVTMRYNSRECADYGTYVGDLTAKIASDYAPPSVYPPPPPIRLDDDDIRVLREYLENLQDMTQVREKDHDQNEIKLVNVSGFNWLKDVGALPELARDVGLSRCLFEKNVQGCAISRDYAEEDTETIDVVLGEIEIMNTYTNEGIPYPPVPPNEVRLNRCIPDSPAYEIMVHEAGHALGIRSIDDIGSRTTKTDEELYRYSHPFGGLLKEIRRNSKDTVMSYSSAGLRCSPHLFDIMAMYALYQTAR